MMYDYFEAMKQDVFNYAGEYVNLGDYVDNNGNIDFEAYEEALNEDLWCADNITGNGSGSYTFNRVEAASYVADNRDLLIEALEDFGSPLDDYKRALTDPEFADVTIRCYLLSSVVADYVEDLKKHYTK